MTDRVTEKSATDESPAALPRDGGPAKNTAVVLSRYLSRQRAGRDEPVVRVNMSKPTPERALSMVFGRSARRSFELVTFSKRSRIISATFSEMIELFPEHGLTLVVENPKGVLGVVVLSLPLLASLIEMQSTGRVSREIPEKRRPTLTDATICAGFVNMILAELASELSAIDKKSAISQFRFASFLENPKPLEVMLDDILYNGYLLDVCVGHEGQREASFMAFLPGDQKDTPNLIQIGVKPDQVPEPTASKRPNLAPAVLRTPIDLNAILCRCQIPLREVRALAVGSMISLPPDALASTVLETQTGQLITQGKLGAMHGYRALRIVNRAGITNMVTDGQLPDKPICDFDGLDQNSDFDSADNLSGNNVFMAHTESNVPKAEEPPIEDLNSADPFRAEPVNSVDNMEIDETVVVAPMIQPITG